MFSRFAGSAARAAARRTATASKSYSTAGASPLKTAKKSSDVVWLAGSVAVFGPTIFYLTSPPHKADPHHSADAKPSFKKKEPAAVKQEQEETEAEEPQPEEEEAAAAAAPATESEPEQKDGEDKSAAVKSDSGEMSPTEEESKDTDGPTPEAIRSGVQVAKTSHQSTPKSVGEAAKASVQEHHARKEDEKAEKAEKEAGKSDDE